MQNRDRTIREPADYKASRAASAAETRLIRTQLARATGASAGDTSSRPLAARQAERPTLRLVVPARAWLVPGLPWPEEAPDQHSFTLGNSR